MYYKFYRRSNDIIFKYINFIYITSVISYTFSITTLVSYYYLIVIISIFKKSTFLWF